MPRRDRGSVTLEVSILAPVLLLVVFTIIQVGLWSYARSLALGAAQEGVAAGRAYGAPAEAGRARAQSFLDATAGDSLVGSAVTVDRDRGHPARRGDGARPERAPRRARASGAAAR